VTADAGVEVAGLAKTFRLYERPFDRLRELVSPTRARYSRDFCAVKDVAFKVPRGATLGLVGDNGAGKSTILKMVAGKLRPTRGDIRVGGRVSAILELGIGMQPALSGRQNARLSGLFLGSDPWTIEGRLDEVLDFAELGEFSDQPLETYSSGMKARLAFSVLVGLQPEILILDEALAAGDAHFAIKCKELLRRLCSSGCTTLVASHDMEFIADACDELVWLERGEVRAQGDPNRVVEQYLGTAEFRAGARPRTALLRFTPANGDAHVDLHCLEWLDASGEFVQGYYPGDYNAFVDLLARARSAGMTMQAARGGWGEPGRHPNGSTFRSVRPAQGPGGVAYLAVPIPGPPSPMPQQVRVGARMDHSADVQVSIFVDGVYTDLGGFGTPSGDEDEHGWSKRVLDLGEALKRADDGEAGP
jgi:ABC-type polysaccharide/polyol phosphate transport system ATPase subunit